MLFSLSLRESRRAAFFFTFALFTVALFTFGGASPQSAQEGEDSNTKEMRQMWRNIVNRRPRRQVRIVRPATHGAKTGEARQVKKEEPQTPEPEPREEEPKPEYKMSSTSIPTQGQDVGITVWRLRPSQQTDASPAKQEVKTKHLRHNHGGNVAGGTTYLTAERVEADTPLRAGEMVQLSVEVPQGGFLYVIDREQYLEGDRVTYGVPYLIFPTSHTNEGFNRVEPGVLLNIPEMTDDPPFFDIERTQPNQVGEEITFVVSPTPIGELGGQEDQIILSDEVFQRLQRWAAQTGRIDLIGGVNKAQTADEAEAAKSSAANDTKRLKHNSPLPQMIFRAGRKPDEPFIVSLVLKIAP